MLIFLLLSALHSDFQLLKLYPYPCHIYNFIPYLILYIFYTNLAQEILLSYKFYISSQKLDSDVHLSDQTCQDFVTLAHYFSSN